MKRFLLGILVFCPLIFSHVTNGATEEKIVVEDKTKQILAKVRTGDYSHIGGIDAINVIIAEVMNISPELRVKRALEIGCGFGGTAHYFSENGFVDLWAMDLKEEAIKSASEKFPEVKFRVADATSLTDDFEDDFFSFVFLLNTAYAISDQSVMWQKIKTVSREGALLAVLDYTRLDKSEPEILAKPNGEPRYPVDMDVTKRVMDYIGWEVVTEKDLTEKFKEWHQEVIEGIQLKHDLLVSSGFTEAEQQYVIDYFHTIITLLEEKKIGGALLIARKL